MSVFLEEVQAINVTFMYVFIGKSSVSQTRIYEVHVGNRVPGHEALQQDEAQHAADLRQALHVSRA